MRTRDGVSEERRKERPKRLMFRVVGKGRRVR